ncbi:MAG: CNNM domain-containing protein, partial [Capnocytophaga ochracea]
MPFLSIDVGIVIQFAVFILLLFCSALISGAEVALFSLTPAEIETLKEEKTPT